LNSEFWQLFLFFIFNSYDQNASVNNMSKINSYSFSTCSDFFVEDEFYFFEELADDCHYCI